MCSVCDKENVISIRDLIEEMNKRIIPKPQEKSLFPSHIKLQPFDCDTLMKVPGCDHVFTVNQLDQYVEKFVDVYEVLCREDSHLLDQPSVTCPAPGCQHWLDGIRRYRDLYDRLELKHKKILDDLNEERESD